MGSHYTISKGSVFCISGPEDGFTISRNMLPVQYACTINTGVLDGQFLILLLMLKHSGMANTNMMTLLNSVIMNTSRHASLCGLTEKLDRWNSSHIILLLFHSIHTQL